MSGWAWFAIAYAALMAICVARWLLAVRDYRRLNTFYQKLERPSGFMGLGKTVERVDFERWSFTMRRAPHPGGPGELEATARQLSAMLRRLAMKAAGECGHLPEHSPRPFGNYSVRIEGKAG